MAGRSELDTDAQVGEAHESEVSALNGIEPQNAPEAAVVGQTA